MHNPSFWKLFWTAKFPGMFPDYCSMTSNVEVLAIDDPTVHKLHKTVENLAIQNDWLLQFNLLEKVIVIIF